MNYPQLPSPRLLPQRGLNGLAGLSVIFFSLSLKPPGNRPTWEAIAMYWCLTRQTNNPQYEWVVMGGVITNGRASTHQ